VKVKRKVSRVDAPLIRNRADRLCLEVRNASEIEYPLSRGQTLPE
jgi:hypothetical protein